VFHTKGGATAGYERWKQFKQHGLNSYANKRNDPAVNFPMGVSRMSAYLHHGHVSPFRLAREVAGSGAKGAAKYLDEMLIWRELSHNFCFHHHQPGISDGLPSWAKNTLDEHRHDTRQPVFTWEQLARAKTGDALWDAAQKSLLIHGELHNNLRMTWGKALLNWTSSPEAALAMMLDLNHRYALDGSDPNSYGGILWCLGLFDRPFKPEKRVIGTLRPRSTRSHAKRLDLSAYAKKIMKPSVLKARRIAVIGAGISGLMAARTLTDSGHMVTVFEKARGPGGRMSTRRIPPYAFDHGAQYFTVKDDRFRMLIKSWMQVGLVQRWNGSVRVVRNGKIHKENRPHQRYVGVPGMSALGRHLAESLDIHFKTRVNQVMRDGDEIILKNESNEPMGNYDALIVSAPAEQSAQLLSEITPLAEQAAGIQMDPCWAVMLAFDEPLNLPFDGAFIQQSPLIWAARNSSKPGRETGDCWVLHAGPDWSQEHLELDAKEVTHQLVASLSEAINSDVPLPLLGTAHRWRYARARNPLKEGCLWDSQMRIGLCGDWCHNSRIEGAFLSGTAMAGRILGTVETWP
jgi:predicted NAD/FAD-dependent oxidoreductase